MVNANVPGRGALFLSIAVLFFVFLGLPAKSQVGLPAGYVNFKASGWLDAAGERTNRSIASLGGWQAGADYWFRLKQKRVEFTLEANYSSLSEPGLDATGSVLKINGFGLQLNAALYPLDFGSDCNCPTWSKNGDAFTKGFFIQFLVGGVFQDKQLRTPDFSSEQQDIAMKLGAGLGLDIGFSEFFTLTPMVRYEYFPNLTWEGIASGALGEDKTSGRQVFAGIRLGFRFNELFKYSVRAY